MRLITRLFHFADGEFTLFSFSVGIPKLQPKTKRQLEVERLNRIVEQTCKPRTRA
jgi:hypothetical protein